MRWVIALFILGACNQVWGLDGTDPADEEIVGARCPAYSVVPTFTKGPFPVTGMEGCRSYHFNTNATYAVAECAGSIRGGPSNAMSPLVLMGSGHDAPRLTPDGDMLYVRLPFGSSAAPNSCGRVLPATGYYIQIFMRQGTAWVPSVDTTGPEGPYGTSIIGISTPWRSSPRRVLLVEKGDMFELQEAACAYWETLTQYTPAMLGATSIADPYFSPEGNRLVFVDGNTLRYGDRPFGDREPAFAPPSLPFFYRGAIQLPGTPPADISTPYLTPDCDRLYYTSGSTVYYVEI